MKFKFFCDKLSGHKCIGLTVGHDEYYIGINLIFWMIGIAKAYPPYQRLVVTEDLRKDA
jgi:hypothetical protein